MGVAATEQCTGGRAAIQQDPGQAAQSISHGIRLHSVPMLCGDRRNRSKEKKGPAKGWSLFTNLHSAGDLTRTEASGAHINVLGRAVDNRLDALHIGLPRTVGAAVRVGHPDAEHNALIAKFTFGHSLILLARQDSLIKHRMI